MPITGVECICASIASVFIFQTYHISDKAVLLINYSDSDSMDMGPVNLYIVGSKSAESSSTASTGGHTHQ